MTQRRSTGSAAAPSGSPAQNDPPTVSHRVVDCPHCGGDSVYAPSNPYRPFCSQRCKDIDFGAWAEESFRVADTTDPEDRPTEDPGPLQ